MCVQKFQEIEEAHLRQMKVLIKSYSHSIEDTHVQVGQVRLQHAALLSAQIHTHTSPFRLGVLLLIPLRLVSQTLIRSNIELPYLR